MTYGKAVKYNVLQTSRFTHNLSKDVFIIDNIINILWPMMFDWINKKMNGSDIVWRRVHQKYVMIWIEQQLHSIVKTTAITFLLLIMINLFDLTMNDSHEVWRWVHRNCVMIIIVQKLHSIKKLILTCCYRWWSIELI